MKYVAILDETKEIIAEGATIRECSDNAKATGVWTDFNSPSGSCAPYYLTTVK